MLAIIAPPTHFEATALDQRVELTWQIPDDPNYAGCMIRRSTQSPPSTSKEGDFIYAGTGIHLLGVESDRGLHNGTTYFYSVFSVDREGDFSQPLSVQSTPTSLTPSDNLLKNASFNRSLEGWKITQSQGSYELINLDQPVGKETTCLRMVATPNVMSHITQAVEGLERKTLYTLTVYCYGSTPDMAPTFTVDGEVQGGLVAYSSIDEALSGYWRELRFVFWTVGQTVNINLFGPQVADVDQDTFVQYTHVYLQKGLLPMPDQALDPHHPFQRPNPPIAQPKVGENLIQKTWNIVDGEQSKNGVIQLNPTLTSTAKAFQNLPYYLSTATHTVKAVVKVDPGMDAYLTVYDLEGRFSIDVPIKNSEWETLAVPIDHTWVRPQITFSTSQQLGHVYLKKIELLADGGEWLPTASAEPSIRAQKRTWDLTKGVFDHDELMVLTQKKSMPQNLSFTEEGLLFTVYGDEAKDLARQGSIILTRDYFASGRYDVWLKVGPVLDHDGKVVSDKRPLGCSFAIFPFSELFFVDGQPQWYDQPESCRNTEIDIELPTEFPKDPLKCPPVISWRNGRLNTWGGQRGGEEGGHLMHVPLPEGIDSADGEFHQYTIIWHSGIDHLDGTRMPGTVEWYVDGLLWSTWTGQAFGFDNIPFRCARFFVGAWFPSNPYGPPGCQTEGWAGTADWYQAHFTVQKIEYTPIFENRPNRDRYQAETYPGLIWNPVTYP